MSTTEPLLSARQLRPRVKRQRLSVNEVAATEKRATTTIAAADSVAINSSSSLSVMTNVSKSINKSSLVVDALTLRWWRMIKSGLVPSHPDSTTKWTDPVVVAQELFGVQSQEITPCLLSIWNRVVQGAALYDDKPSKRSSASTLSALTRSDIRSDLGLVRIWGQRGTIHVYSAKDWPYISGLMTTIHQDKKSIRTMSVTVARHFKQECTRLRKHFQLNTTEEVHIKSSDYPTRPLVFRRDLMMQLTLEGHCAGRIEDTRHGGMVLSSRSAISPDLQWHTPSQLESTRVICKRYFKTYGPALESDFRYWAGISATLSKPVVQNLIDADELVIVTVSVGDEHKKPVNLLISSDDFTDFVDFISNKKLTKRKKLPARLLGRFDPVLLAHKDKSWIVTEEQRARIWTSNGFILACIYVNNAIHGLWTYELQSGKEKATRHLVVVLKSFPESSPLTADQRMSLERQVAGLATFFSAESYECKYQDWTS